MNGIPSTLPVPDLGALRGMPPSGQDIVSMVAGAILTAAGVSAGGPSRVLTSDDQDLLLDDTNVVVMVAPAGPVVFGITGTRTTEFDETALTRRVLVPWHAVVQITGRTLP